MDHDIQQYRRRMAQGEGSVEGYFRLLSRSGFSLGESLSEHHRQVAWMHLLNPGSADFSGMGTQKKLPAIEAIRVLLDTGLAKRCLIVSPATILPYWSMLFQQHAPELQVVSLTGKVSKKRKLLESHQGQVFIATYGGVIPRSLGENIVQQDWDIVVADEAHYLSNPMSKRSDFLYRLADKTHYKIALTGCFRPQNLWGIFRFVDSSVFGTSYRKFLETHFTVDDSKPWGAWAGANAEKMVSRLYNFCGATWNKPVREKKCLSKEMA